MTTLTPVEQARVAEYEALLAANPKAALELQSLNTFLLNSEYALISYMVEQKVWQGTVPPPPAGYQQGDGTIELGLFLYWFNNPLLLNGWQVQLAAIALCYANKMPPSQMTQANYTYLDTHQLIYVDGSVLSTELYANFDQGWFAAFINLLETVLRNLWYNGGNFPWPATPKAVPLKGASSTSVNIALVGDWGSGAADAIAVMKQISTMKPAPDYIIHLGDVYYGGTPSASDPNTSHYLSLGEEAGNFVNLWPAAWNGKSFTINSNHEMYSGASGLFLDALNPTNSPFSAQQGLSCFLLQYGDWNILGLDSAFNGTSTDAFMSGNIGSATGTQAAWVSSLKLDPKKTIVLTHHTGFEYDASAVDALWAQVNQALGGDPYAWYWGHAHNGIVYANPVSIAASKSAPAFSTDTYARCCGHGALPYGVATALQNNANVLWQASTPMPSSTQVYNGWAMLTLTLNNNQVSEVAEAFYDPGCVKATWEEVIFGG
jgi:hypothetical protein